MSGFEAVLEAFGDLRRWGEEPLGWPLWVVPALHVLLSGMACLAAWRQWKTPAHTRRYALRLYALCTLLFLPTRTAEEAQLARVAFIFASVVLLFVLANIRRPEAS